jgi:hypothetical protein
MPKSNSPRAVGQRPQQSLPFPESLSQSSAGFKPQWGAKRQRIPFTVTRTVLAQNTQINLEYSFCRALAFSSLRHEVFLSIIVLYLSPPPHLHDSSPYFQPQILSSLFPRANRRSGARAYLDLVYPR